VKWMRAVSHLQALAQACAEMATWPSSMLPLRVVQVWGRHCCIEQSQVILAGNLAARAAPSTALVDVDTANA
jgi:hypothetical protein